MMWLGPFRFGITGASHDTLQQASQYRWEEVPLVGARPEMHYLGPGTETRTLSGTIYPHFRGGLGQVEAMRQQAAMGAPHLMGDGLGFVFGRWVITGVDDTRSVLMADGAPRKIEFALKLQRAAGLLA
jgi:phage protein U